MAVKVRERPKNSGIWWIFIDHQGKRRAKKFGTDEEEANKAARKIEAKLVLGEFNIATKKEKVPLFKVFSEQWLAIHVKPTKRKTTYNRYRSILRMYLNKTVGNIPMNELKRSHVLKALRLIQAKGLSRSSVENARNVISGICEFAIDHEYLLHNPCAGVLKRMGLQKKNHKKPVVVFTDDEISMILDTCEKLFPEWYPFYLTASRTGLRLGELLALKWEKVNWQSKYIVIDSTFRNGLLTPVKNDKPRNVDMSDQLIATLRALHIKRKEEALKAGSNEVEPIIFHTRGGYTSQNTVRNVWKRMLEKTKLDHRKFHTIRHTFASLLISKGKSLAYIKDMLGHYSIQMTVDVYGHLVPSENRKAVNSLDEDTTDRNLSATTNKKASTTS